MTDKNSVTEEQEIYELLGEFESVVTLLNDLQIQKKALVDKITSFRCAKEGKSKTFDILDKKLKVVYPLEFRVDEKKYNDFCDLIPDDCNPVTEITKYKVNSKMAETLLINSELCEIASEFLIKSERSKSISINYGG